MLKAGHNPAFNILPFASRLCNMQISMCLLCPLPTGSPMTPASWGVRRMLFGYSSHSRWLSCAQRWFAVSPVFPCQSVLIRGRYIFPAICCVLPVVWQCSRLFPFAPVGCHALVIPITSKSLPLHPTPKIITKHAFFFDLMTGFVSLIEYLCSGLKKITKC